MKKAQKRQPGQIKLIRKSNELVEARYRFDLWETRVFAKMLSMIRPEDNELLKYDIHLGEIIRDLKLHDKGETYAVLRDASGKLLTRVIEIEKITPEGVKLFKTPLLISAEGFKDPKDGNFISVQFHPDLKPFLLELRERYLQYDIRNLWGMTSVYSIRIYELLKQYEKIGWRNFDLENLRLILGIHPDEYKLYGHFKDKVIAKAQADLAKSTDISFELEEQKKGRKVSNLIFHIHQNVSSRNAAALMPSLAEENLTKKIANRQKSELLESPAFEEIFRQVKVWKVPEVKLREIFVEFGEARVRTGLDCTLDHLKSGKPLENPGGFFCKAVEEGWVSSSQNKKQRTADQHKKKQEEAEQWRTELENTAATLEKLVENRKSQSRSVVRRLTEKEADLAEKAIEQILANSFGRGFLERSTGLSLENLSLEDWRTEPQLREAVIGQIEKMYPADFWEIQQRFDAEIKSHRSRVEVLKSYLR